MGSEYETQAENFLKETKTTFKAKFLKNDFYFPDDKEARDIYKITLKKEGKSYSFKFGQSIAEKGEIPTAYTVLSGLTKYEPDTFENFCSDFGYDTDSRKAEKTYKAVLKEWENINRLYTPGQIEKMQEIQ